MNNNFFWEAGMISFKTHFLPAVFAAFFATAVLWAAGCQKDDKGADPTGNAALNAQASDCLHNNKLEGGDDSWPTQNETIEFSLADGMLSVTHHFSPRNCAFGQLIATYEIGDGALSITEGEPGGGGVAACMCCFDLSYEIPSVAVASYQLTIRTKYWNGEAFEFDPVLDTTVDFTAQADYEITAREVMCF